MKEGAWIHAASGTFAWIDEHARWIRRQSNAKSLGLSDEVISSLEAIRPDEDGPGRFALLHTAMDAGLIRFRGHGAFCTLEGTLPWIELLRGASAFLEANAGGQLMVCIHDLRQQEALHAPWWVLQQALETGHPEELQRLVEACHVRSPRPHRRSAKNHGETPEFPLFVATRESVMVQVLENHPGLTRGEFLEMSKGLGF